VSLKKTLNP